MSCAVIPCDNLLLCVYSIQSAFHNSWFHKKWVNLCNRNYDGGISSFLLCYAQSPVMSDPVQSHGLQPTRLLCPWDFPGKNTLVGCHFLPRGSSQPKDRTRVSCESCIGSNSLPLCQLRSPKVDCNFLLQGLANSPFPTSSCHWVITKVLPYRRAA